MGLPESTEVLGVFVRALQANVHARGKGRGVLQGRTARRCFAGETRIRHWCCQIGALLDFLGAERLVQETGRVPLRSLLVSLGLGAAMARWDRDAAAIDAFSPRARLAAGAVQLACIVRWLEQDGVVFGGGAAMQAALVPFPSDGPARSPGHDMLLRVHAAAGRPTQRAIADEMCVGAAAVGRWFKQGKRPNLESIRGLARVFGRALAIDEEAIVRTLYWPYAITELLVLMERRCEGKGVARVDLDQIHALANALVDWKVCRCERLDLRMFFAALLMPAPPQLVVNLDGIGGLVPWWPEIMLACALQGGGDAERFQPSVELEQVLERTPGKRRVARLVRARRLRG